MNISNHGDFSFPIISYQAITGNNNNRYSYSTAVIIISYQAITGNNNEIPYPPHTDNIISYQAITGNNNRGLTDIKNLILYHTKR